MDYLYSLCISHDLTRGGEGGRRIMTGNTWFLEGGKGGLSSPIQYEGGYSKLTAS